jgi:hypothetical protein
MHLLSLLFRAVILQVKCGLVNQECLGVVGNTFLVLTRGHSNLIVFVPHEDPEVLVHALGQVGKDAKVRIAIGRLFNFINKLGAVKLDCIQCACACVEGDSLAL